MTLAIYTHKRHDQRDLGCLNPKMCGTLLRIFSNIIGKYTPFYHFYRTLLQHYIDITPYILITYSIFTSLKLYKGGIVVWTMKFQFISIIQESCKMFFHSGQKNYWQRYFFFIFWSPFWNDLRWKHCYTLIWLSFVLFMCL